MRIRGTGERTVYIAVAVTFAFLSSSGSAAAQASAGRFAPITVRWLGHAAFEITSSGGMGILIDPFITGNPSTPDSLKSFTRYGGAWKPNAILVSHSHSDHPSMQKRLRR